MSFIEEFKVYIEQYGQPDRIELLLCDINAVIRGKWLPGDQYKKLAKGSIRMPLSTYAPNIMGLEVEATGLGILAGDPDGVVLPVKGSLKPVPWVEENVAQVLVEIHEQNPDEADFGPVSDLSPRQQLSNTIKKFSDKALFPVAAAELEFYFIEERLSPDDAPIAPSGSPEAQNFDLESMYRFQAILDEIIDSAKVQGLASDTLIAEYGPAQFEVNFHHTADILFAADTALLFRRIVRCVAKKHGLDATFMAKPYRDYPGNGMHLHVSVVDAEDRNIFDLAYCGHDNSDQATSDEDTPEVSSTLKNAVAGSLATMRDMQAVFAPHLNSLRRFESNSFAPNTPEWGCDHRGAAVRIPETQGIGARLEHRISGADTNPYLAVSAILAGILYGLDSKPELPPMLSDEVNEDMEPLCSDWLQTVNTFADSDFAKTVFGDSFHHIFTQVKLDEIRALSTQISSVEYRYYLSRL